MSAGSFSLNLASLNLSTRLGSTHSGVISGSRDFTFEGPGRLTLDAANTYTGSTVVSAGTLALGASGSLQSASVIQVASGAVFDLNGRTQTVAGLHGAGSVQLGAGALTVNAAADRTLSGAISGTGSLAKSGAGALTLSASNSHSGGTTLSAGAIRVGHNSALGSGVATLNGGALSSDSASARTLANNLTLGGNVTLGDAANSGALTFSGTVGLGAATRTLTVASDVTLAGVVSNGGLTKSGAGTLTLSGANTYAGATLVSAGTLAIGSAGSIGDSASIQIAAGATLDVSASSGFTLASGQSLSGGGTVAGDTVIAGTHTPGFSPGLQTFTDNLTYANGSTVVWELAANSTSGRGVSFDGIDVQGDLAFQGTVNLSLVFNAAGGAVDWSNPFWNSPVSGTDGWKIFDVTGAIVDFSNLQISAVALLDSQGVALSNARPGGSFALHADSSGVYLNYTPVPEPSAYGLLLGGLALAGATRRRRAKA